ncbi:MAG: hypothetical protein Q8906_01910 [Bacillota bacterium]|nr:hypothetical protein [Bacillota bacterium]
MVFRIFFWLIGFGMAVSGGISMIAFLNIMTAGYSFAEYIKFIVDKPISYLLPIGVAILSCSIFYPEKKTDDV